MPRAVAAALVIIAGMGPATAQDDVLAALGTTLEAAQDVIFSSLTTGIPSLAGEASVFKAASPERRAAMARAVISVARAYTATPDFARRYAQYRETLQPRPPSLAKTGDEARKRQQDAMEQAIAEAVAGAAQASPEVRRELEANIAEMRRQIAELNEDPDYRATVDELAAAAAKEEAAAYARDLAIFNEEFPEDADALIARRLRQFLLACENVDFAAALTKSEDGTLRFANAAYERRSADWKRCYRAGKPAVDAARAAAQEWLTEVANPAR